MEYLNRHCSQCERAWQAHEDPDPCPWCEVERLNQKNVMLTSSWNEIFQSALKIADIATKHGGGEE